MKKKVYLVISSWSIGGGEYGYEVLGAYSNLNMAKDKLEEDLKEMIKLHNLNYATSLKEKSDDFYKLMVNHNGIETLSTKIIVKEVEEDE